MYAPIPDGEVKVLTNIPLDPDYNHTIFFASETARTAYFESHTSSYYSFDKMIYIRQTGRVRAPVSGDLFQNCNYMMYRNKQYLDKWFYAFIKQIYYINDNCCEIEFDIDVMQTYFPNCLIPECWIERAHTPTDKIGDNRVSENIDIGGYEIESTSRPDELATDWTVIMYSTFDPKTFQATGGTLNNGMYSALARTAIGRLTMSKTQSGVTNATWVTSPIPIIEDIVNNHADLVEGIVAIILTPTFFENNRIKQFTVTRPLSYTGYTVRNKKLFTAPYLALYISDGTSNGKFYEFEEFISSGGVTAQFGIFSDNAPAQSVILAPYNYKGSGADSMNYSEMMIETSFPQCAWASDTFKTYLAQNQTNIGLSSALSVAQIVGGAFSIAGTKGVGAAVGLGMISSGLTSIAGQVADINDKSKRPPTSHGNVTGTALYIAGEKTFRAYVMRPRTEYLKIIDDYFDKFGYAIKAFGKPNFNARPHWTYIKTSDVVVKAAGGYAGSASDRKKIAQILDRGITFWNDPTKVGDYSLDNTV